MEQDLDENYKSKSQIKRELHALQDLGKQLFELPEKQLNTMPISDNLREAIQSAHAMRTKHGALKRQLKFIGGLMVDEDETAILQALEKLQQVHQNAVNQFHEIEQWRDKLIEGDQVLFDELANKFEQFERQYVNQLIRNTRKEQQQNKPPKSARLLFKYLSELCDA